MKTFLRFSLYGVGVIALFFLLGWWLREPAPDVVENMPWQISTNADGQRGVFGITLGRTTLGEARKLMVREAQLALFAADGMSTDSARMEAFFDLVPLGTMISRVVLTIGLDGLDVDALRERAVDREPASTGEWRHAPSLADLAALDAQPVIAISYVPVYVRFQNDMLTSRFGAPAEIVDEGEGRGRWRYPELGLEVLLDERGKAVFEYR
ncbi:MAG: hypothetical protein H6926_01080 [Chromatiales bacterium]|nr:hypothetical protein [Gammaproteobacteria bacterium]MCP5351773.1 hypothetical protein [Chromatiales bacterium]